MGLIRKQHAIKDNKGTEYPRQFLFVDTETRELPLSENEIEHVLRLGTCLYWHRGGGEDKDVLEWHEFTTIGEFWNVVERYAYPKTRLVIVAHYLPFDMEVLQGFRVLGERGFKPTKLILDSRRNIWKFKRDISSLLFLDNMNYFNTSLRVLGESIGCPKLPMPSQDAPDEDWKVYCRQDVEVLHQAWQLWLKFVGDNDLGAFGVTLASQAFNAFRHRFMPCKIYVHVSNKAIRLERASYRGGRNECFRMGRQPNQTYRMVDVNSMYPYVMKNWRYPVNLISTGKVITTDKLTEYLRQYCVIAEVVVRTTEPCYAIKERGKLVFPVGEFYATLTTRELLHGLARGHIREVHNFSLYENHYIFGDYVRFFYNSRQHFARTGNQAYAYLAKIMLNSLYGKFGQKVEDWKYIGDDDTRDYDFWTEWDVAEQKLYTYRCIEHHVEERVGEKEGYNALVAISAEVTANARLYLWTLMNDAGRENVYYSDTDSLIVNQAGYDNLRCYLDEHEIGKLKTVAESDYLILHGLKDYELGSDRKIKGIKLSATQLADGCYRQYQSVGLRGGLHRGDVNRAIWHDTIKEVKRVYNKGIILPDGKVEPIIMDTYGTFNILNNHRMVESYGSDAVFDGTELIPLYSGKLRYGGNKAQPSDSMSSQDIALADAENLRKRQDGEMIYQRGRW